VFEPIFNKSLNIKKLKKGVFPTSKFLSFYTFGIVIVFIVIENNKIGNLEYV